MPLENGWGNGSNLWPKFGAFLSNWASDGGTLHFTLIVDDNTSVVLEADDDTILPSPESLLPTDNAAHDLLPKSWLTLLDGNNNKI